MEESTRIPSHTPMVNSIAEAESDAMRPDVFFRPVMNALNDMIRIVTREGKVAFTNEAFDRKLAHGVDTRGRYCYELFSGEEGSGKACDPCASGLVMASGKPRQMTRKLNDRQYAVTVSPLTHPGTGEIVGTLEVFKETTLVNKIYDNLVKQNSQLKNNVYLARGVQQALVKGVLPKVPGYRLFAHFYPCEAVGGDMYDCITTDDKVVMYVSDTAGHGVMPAMLGVFFSRAVRSACTMGITDPGEILAYVQKEFQELDAEDATYITGFVLVLDPGTGDFTYSNAGLSVAPAFFHDGGVSELYLESPPVSKWFPNPNFKVASAHMDPGDRIAIYSDGITTVQSDTDALSRLHEMFQRDEFMPQEFVRDVLNELMGRHQDDVTMFICEREPVTTRT